MAKLDYTLPASVMDAYGKAMAGPKPVNVSSALKPMQDLASDAAKAKAEKDKQALKREEEEAIIKANSEDKFYRSLEKYQDVGTNYTPEIMTDFEERFIRPLADEHDKSAVDLDKKGQREARGHAKSVSKNLQQLSGSVSQIASNQEDLLYDIAAFPPGVQDKMSAIMDMRGSGATLEVNPETMEVFYRVPANEATGEPGYDISKSEIETWNTTLLIPEEARENISKVFSQVGPASIKNKGKFFNKADYLVKINKEITPSNVRSLVYNKDVWGSSTAGGEMQSWADQWTDGSEESVGIDIDGDGKITNVKLTGSDKKRMIEELCKKENFNLLKGLLSEYASGRIDREISKGIEPQESSSEVVEEQGSFLDVPYDGGYRVNTEFED